MHPYLGYLLIVVTLVGAAWALRYALNNTRAKKYGRVRARERTAAEEREQRRLNKG